MEFPQTFFFVAFILVIGQRLVQRESGLIFSKIQLPNEKMPLSPTDENLYHMQLRYAFSEHKKRTEIVILGPSIFIGVVPHLLIKCGLVLFSRLYRGNMNKTPLSSRSWGYWVPQSWKLAACVNWGVSCSEDISVFCYKDFSCPFKRGKTHWFLFNYSVYTMKKDTQTLSSVILRFQAVFHSWSESWPPWS